MLRGNLQFRIGHVLDTAHLRRVVIFLSDTESELDSLSTVLNLSAFRFEVKKGGQATDHTSPYPLHSRVN